LTKTRICKNDIPRRLTKTILLTSKSIAFQVIAIKVKKRKKLKKNYHKRTNKTKFFITMMILRNLRATTSSNTLYTMEKRLISFSPDLHLASANGKKGIFTMINNLIWQNGRMRVKVRTKMNTKKLMLMIWSTRNILTHLLKIVLKRVKTNETLWLYILKHFKLKTHENNMQKI